MTDPVLKLDREAEERQLRNERTDPEFEPEAQRPQVGDKVVFMVSGLIYQQAAGDHLTSQVSRAGETYELTRADIQNVDRLGQTFWDLTYDPERQRARWGEVKFKVSDPETDPATHWSDPRWQPENSADADEARVAARARAITLPEPARSEELRKITARFGMQSVSQTITTYKYGEDAS